MILQKTPEQLATLAEFDAVYAMLKRAFDKLKEFDYATRYQSLWRSEAAYAGVVLDPTDPTSESLDLNLINLIFDAPLPMVLQDMNRNLFRATYRKNLLTNEYTYATDQLGQWQSLSVDVESFFEKIKNFYLTIAEIKVLKTIGDREAEIFQHIPEVLELRDQVRHYYSKDGNFLLGEAYLYRNAIQKKLEVYDTILASLSKHIDIFQKMKDAGM